MPTQNVPQSLFDTYLKSLDINENDINQLAEKSGWLKRTPRNITPAALLFSLCKTSMNGGASFNDIASTMSRMEIGCSPSKQAVAKRINKSFLEILEELLASLITKKIAHSDISSAFSDLLAPYDRILLQDSTIVKLPSWLFDAYSGVANATTQVCNARIQAVYDLKNMKFLHFSIDAYSKTDVTVAQDLEIQANDLVIRDRGYLTIPEIARHIQEEAYFIYRHKAKFIYHDPESQDKIELLKTLKKHGSLDKTVCLNDEARTKVRLVAQRVEKAVAATRRRKLKKEANNKNPSKELLELCDWSIYLTNITDQGVGFKELLHIYGLRWRIEIIFKTWKSHLNFAKIHRVSEIELKVLLKIRLLLITEGTNVLYQLCVEKVFDLYGKDLSLQKMIKQLAQDPEIFGLINQGFASKDENHEAWKFLSRYCCYDKRKRKNFNQKCREGKN